MNRRDFISGGVVGLVVGGAAGWFGRASQSKKMAEAPKKADGGMTKPAAPAVMTKKVKQLRMVTSWPKNFPGLGTAANRVAERINKASDGRYEIKVFAGGELVHPLKCNDAVQQGNADMYHSADYYYQGKHKAYNFFTAVPGGFTATEIDAWIFHGGGQALWDEVGAQFGVKHLPGSNTGMQMGGWFKKPITSIDDFKGLKMRIPGLGGAVIKQLGGTSVTLAGSEILPNLQSGNIDATEWVGPWNDLAFGFYKVVKNAMYPGIHEPGSMLSVGISKKFWDGLSATDQAMFTACCLAENDYGYAEFVANNTAALETLEGKHGVKYIPFPQDVFKAMAEAARDVVADVAKSDPLTKKVYESYIKFRKNASTWSRYSDAIYYNYRDLVRY
jgi:TRAP-type mannitol/chloroaromatic compound transport system substrate-binding protein